MAKRISGTNESKFTLPYNLCRRKKQPGHLTVEKWVDKRSNFDGGWKFRSLSVQMIEKTNKFYLQTFQFFFIFQIRRFTSFLIQISEVQKKTVFRYSTLNLSTSLYSKCSFYSNFVTYILLYLTIAQKLDFSCNSQKQLRN